MAQSINLEEIKRSSQFLVGQGKFEQALDMLDSKTTGCPTEVLAEKSRVLHVMGDNKEAINALTQSLNLGQTADKYCILADLHNDIEKPQMALQNYSKAIQIKETYTQPQTKVFLENSIIIKELFKLKQLAKEQNSIEQKICQNTPNEMQQLLVKSRKAMGLILRYDYNEDIDRAKRQNIVELREMLDIMNKKISALEQENKKMKQQQAHFYKNHEVLFNQTLEHSTLSHQNQQILKLYFTTFCNKMELFFMSLKLLNKVPESNLSLKEIYHYSQGKEEKMIQIQHQLKYYADYLDKAKGILDQIPYVSIVFSIFGQFDKYFSKYIEKVHESHKISSISKSWMNVQVFNDYIGDLAHKIAVRMKLRILNYSEPSFKSYLKLLYAKLIKKYKFRGEAAKIKELESEMYDKKAYIAKLAERDAGIVFYAFEIERLKRKADTDLMAHEVIQFIEEIDNIKIQETETLDQNEEKIEKKGYCLLF